MLFSLAASTTSLPPFACCSQILKQVIIFPPGGTLVKLKIQESESFLQYGGGMKDKLVLDLRRCCIL